MKERWTVIDGYEKYEVSNFGRVRNEKKAILKPVKSNGYLAVNLYNDLGIRQVKVHRLVGMAYLPRNQSQTQINHIDGNKHNNKLSNLEWCTASENSMHAHRILKIKHYGGTPKKKVRNVETGEVFESIADAGKSVGTSYQNIRQGIANNSLRMGYHWEYL